MKKLLIPLVILLSLSACDFPDFRGVSNEPNYQYIFNGYVVIGNPAENYGDTILVYPDYDLEFVSQLGKTPNDSLFDIFVVVSDNIKILNVDTSRVSDLSASDVFILGYTLKCSVMNSESGRIQFVIHDPEDYVFAQSFPVLNLEVKN
jgi:hypothetical protein